MDKTRFTTPEALAVIWMTIHKMGLAATTDLLKEAFVININMLCDGFPCPDCATHFRKFIDDHSLRKYWHIRDFGNKDIGFFKWTWELHNDVNRRLGKQEFSLTESYNLWVNFDKAVCTSCGKEGLGKETILGEHVSIPQLSYNTISIPGYNLNTTNGKVPPILTQYRQVGNIQPKPFILKNTTVKI